MRLHLKWRKLMILPKRAWIAEVDWWAIWVCLHLAVLAEILHRSRLVAVVKATMWEQLPATATASAPWVVQACFLVQTHSKASHTSTTTSKTSKPSNKQLPNLVHRTTRATIIIKALLSFHMVKRMTRICSRTQWTPTWTKTRTWSSRTLLGINRICSLIWWIALLSTFHSCRTRMWSKSNVHCQLMSPTSMSRSKAHLLEPKSFSRRSWARRSTSQPLLCLTDRAISKDLT